MFGKDFMKKLQQAQSAISEMQAKLDEIKVEFSTGGGMVTVVMNGKKELLDLRIDAQVVDPNDVEMLQDLIMAAINGASMQVEDEIQKQMGDLQNLLGTNII
ncbi:YbaB/EbfC family nucleoid-associated protein [bacterium]|nr:MAG: YbaB/EbfC family nucleoid-associated protein [bacterium]